MLLSARGLSLGALVVAATVLLVYLAVAMPANRLFFLGASTLGLHILALEAGPAAAGAAVLASSLLVFLLLPVGPWTLAFWGFFAPYALVKYGAGRLRRPALAWMLKLLFFNLGLAGALALFLVAPAAGEAGLLARLFPWGDRFWPATGGASWFSAVVAVGNGAFLVYDWALSYFAAYWMRRFRPRYGT
ncbi:MAG: hypothetical protein QME70_04700 [Bacillota bacterium]|nr:hypothetical protein [Bacillota bacterium]